MDYFNIRVERTFSGAESINVGEITAGRTPDRKINDWGYSNIISGRFWHSIYARISISMKKNKKKLFYTYSKRTTTTKHKTKKTIVAPINLTPGIV